MFARMLSLWRQDDWRALFAGIAYVALYALIGQMDWQSRLRALRTQRRRVRASSMRIAVTATVRELAGVAASIVYPLAMVLLGVFSPGDLGLGWGHLDASIWRLLGATAGWIVWLAVLWGRDALPVTEAPQRSAHADDLLATVSGAIIAEARLATCRAALMPLAGSYWGMWLGVGLALLTAQTNPITQWRLSVSGWRRRVWLDRALDWVSTAAYATMGTVWAAMLVRVLCRTTLHLSVLRAPQEPALPYAASHAVVDPDPADNREIGGAATIR